MAQGRRITTVSFGLFTNDDKKVSVKPWGDIGDISIILEKFRRSSYLDIWKIQLYRILTKYFLLYHLVTAKITLLLVKFALLKGGLFNNFGKKKPFFFSAFVATCCCFPS